MPYSILKLILVIFPNHMNSLESILGIRTLATLSNGLKIANLDVSHEEKNDQKIPKKTIQERIPNQPLQRHLKNLLEMGRPKKEQNKRLL